MAGPFEKPPFDVFHISPLGLRPKSTPGKFRVIHDLSFPYNKHSVNGSIPHELASVKYADVQTAISYILQLGQGSHLAKSDIKSAFRLVSVHPTDYRLLGFKFQGKYFYDKCLTMGCSSSCSIFEAFSSSLEWILKHKFGVLQCTHMIDDFLIVEKTMADCSWSLKIFQAVCKRLGVPLAPEKTVGPATALTYLGVELCTIKMMAYLPQEKLRRYAADIEQMLQMKTCRMKEFQQIAGKLNWATSVVLPGRAFNQRLFDAIRGISNPVYFVKLNEGIKQDLRMWQEFLEFHNGKVFISKRRVMSSEDLQLFTDASSKGAGVVFGEFWQQLVFPPSWAEYNIAVLELFPIVVAVATFYEAMAGKHIVFNTDNQAIVCVLRAKTAKDKMIMVLVRKLVLLCLKYDILFDAVHIPGKLNCLPDAISRLQDLDGLLRAREMRMEPTPVLKEWLPMNFEW